MAINWKVFTQRPYIKSLSLEEQVRLFRIANEKSIRLRESKFQDFSNSNSTSQGAAGDGDTGVTPFINTRSLDFDGNDDYIDLGDADVFSFGNGSSDFPFTISAWVYIEGSSTFPVFDKYPDNGSWSLREYRMLEVNSSNKVFCTLYDSSASARFDIYSDSLITRNQWEHLCITYDGRGGSSASDGIKIYINGVESNKTVNAFGTYVAMENKSTPVRIGRVGSAYAEGKIDEVALFDSDRTSNIATIYNGGVPGDLSSLSPVAWYRFEEGSGTTAIDAGSGGNNGTINGAVYTTDVPT